MVTEDIRETDLKVFEDRLKTSIDSLNPYAAKWRYVPISNTVTPFFWHFDINDQPRKILG